MGVVATSNALLPARAIRRMAAALAAAALIISWIGRCTDADLALADAVFDAAGGVFPWRHAWLAETFSHLILKWLLMLLALGFIGRALIDLAWPRAGMSGHARLRLRIVALSALLVPLTISMLKQFSTSHCPWDLLRYGGDQPYLCLFEALPCRPGMRRAPCGCCRWRCTGCRHGHGWRGRRAPSRLHSALRSAICSSCAAPIS